MSRAAVIVVVVQLTPVEQKCSLRSEVVWAKLLRGKRSLLEEGNKNFAGRFRPSSDIAGSACVSRAFFSQEKPEIFFRFWSQEKNVVVIWSTRRPRGGDRNMHMQGTESSVTISSGKLQLAPPTRNK